MEIAIVKAMMIKVTKSNDYDSNNVNSILVAAIPITEKENDNNSDADCDISDDKKNDSNMNV